jgi:molybdopterin converting factor small subunit
LKVKVLFFGNLSELVSDTYLEIESVTDTNELLKKLTVKFPSLKNYNYRIAVNQTMEEGTTILKNNDEIALLPPFSGG